MAGKINVFLEGLGLIFLLPTRWKYCSSQCDLEAVLVWFTWMKLSVFLMTSYACLLHKTSSYVSQHNIRIHNLPQVSQRWKVREVISQYTLRCQCLSCSICKNCCPFFSKYYFLEIQSCLLYSQAVTGQIHDQSNHNIFTLKKYLKS